MSTHALQKMTCDIFQAMSLAPGENAVTMQLCRICNLDHLSELCHSNKDLIQTL